MRAIFLMLDTLNRRFLNCYGAEDAAITPNIDRLAKRGVVFDNHWVGSSPCMPARRDLMTGRLNFLECPWGGIQPFEDTFVRVLGKNNIFTRLETDHLHYGAKGGENYCSQFTSWFLHRGTSHDTVNLRPCQAGIPDITSADSADTGWLGIYDRAYHATRDKIDFKKENYSTNKTYAAAAEWLEECAGADNFLLWVEGFDPHEPFDSPGEYLDLYADRCNYDEKFFWPPYDTTDGYSEEQIRQMKYRYMANLTMADEYLGKVLDVLDEKDMWKDTAVFFTTDHGYLLGEHDYFAKNYMPDYNELMHIPFIACVPGQRPGRVDALTQNIDVFPTMLEVFEIGAGEAQNPIHGKSLLPLMRDPNAKNRDAVLFGQFGKNVSLTDGDYVYMRAPASEENLPLNLYTAMPYYLETSIGLDSMDPADFAKIEVANLPWTEYPVFKYSAEIVRCDTSQGFNGRLPHACESMLFDNRRDYEQLYPLCDDALEEKYIQILRDQLEAYDAPPEQAQRLGI